MKRPMFWILLGCALLSFPLSGCYTQLGYPAGYSGGDPYGSGYDDYSDDNNWIEGYYTLLPYSWDPAFDRSWWYCDYHQPHWRDYSYYDNGYDSYDHVSDQNGWPRDGGAHPPRGNVVRGGGGGGGAVTVEEPAPTTQSRNPARTGTTRTSKETEKKSSSTEKSRDKKRRGWGR